MQDGESTITGEAAELTRVGGRVKRERFKKSRHQTAGGDEETRCSKEGHRVRALCFFYMYGLAF